MWLKCRNRNLWFRNNLVYEKNDYFKLKGNENLNKYYLVNWIVSVK